MADFEIKDGVAIIPEGTTEIEHLYYGNDSITSVAIPKSVMYISAGAFKDCSSLTSIVTTVPIRIYSQQTGTALLSLMN